MNFENDISKWTTEVVVLSELTKTEASVHGKYKWYY